MQIEQNLQDQVPTFEEEVQPKIQVEDTQKVVLDQNCGQQHENQQVKQEQILNEHSLQQKSIKEGNSQQEKPRLFHRSKKSQPFWTKEEEYLFITFLVGSLDQIEDTRKARIPFGWYKDMASFIKTRTHQQCRSHYRKKVHEMDITIKQFVKQQIVFKKETQLIQNQGKKIKIKKDSYIYKLLGVKFNQKVFRMLDNDLSRFKQVFLNKLESQHTNQLNSQQDFGQYDEVKPKKIYKKNKKNIEPEINFSSESKSQDDYQNVDKRIPRGRYAKQQKNKLANNLEPITSVATTICDCQNKADKDRYDIETQKQPISQVNEKQIEKQILKSAERQLQIIKKRIIGQLTCLKISNKAEKNQKLIKMIESLAKCELEQMFAVRFRLKVLAAYQEKYEKMIKTQVTRQNRKNNLWIQHLHKLKRDRKRIVDLEKKLKIDKLTQEKVYQDYGLNTSEQQAIIQFNQIIKKSSFANKSYEMKPFDIKTHESQLKQIKSSQRKSIQSEPYQENEEQERYNDKKHDRRFKKGNRARNQQSPQSVFRSQIGFNLNKKRKFTSRKRLQSLSKNQPNLIITKNQGSKMSQADLTMEILKSKIAQASIRKLQSAQKPARKRRTKKQKKAKQAEMEQNAVEQGHIQQQDAIKMQFQNVQNAESKASPLQQEYVQAVQQMQSQHSLEQDQQEYYMLESVSNQNFVLQRNQDNEKGQKMDVQAQQQKFPDNKMNTNQQQEQSRLPDLSNTIRFNNFTQKSAASDPPKSGTALIKQQKPEVYQNYDEGPEIYEQPASEPPLQQLQPKKQIANLQTREERSAAIEQVCNKIEEQPSSNQDDKRQKEPGQVAENLENKNLKIEESDKKDVNLDSQLNQVFKDMFGKYMIFDEKSGKRDSGPLIQ